MRNFKLAGRQASDANELRDGRYGLTVSVTEYVLHLAMLSTDRIIDDVRGMHAKGNEREYPRLLQSTSRVPLPEQP